MIFVRVGTPFDRHTIIEDSHETKKKKKWAPKLEEPAGNGLGGLLRRLSKRDRDRSNYGMDGMHRNPQVNICFDFLFVSNINMFLWGKLNVILTQSQIGN